jgi:hypothetical protein
VDYPFIFSSTVISDDQKYGPKGGVVVLGALAGLARARSVCPWPSRLCSRCQTACRRSGRTATTRFAVIPRPNGDSDALLSEGGCRLAEGKLARQ